MLPLICGRVKGVHPEAAYALPRFGAGGIATPLAHTYLERKGVTEKWRKAEKEHGVAIL